MDEPQPTHGDLARELAHIKADIVEMKEIIKAWSAAKTAGGAVIWFGKVLLGAAALFLFFKGGFAALSGK